MGLSQCGTASCDFRLQFRFVEHVQPRAQILTTPIPLLTLSNTTLNASNRNYPDPYEKRVGDVLTIEFYGYQEPLNYEDMCNCEIAALEDGEQKMRDHEGRNPMPPGPYVWSSGSVALHMIPEGEKLTWSKWYTVPRLITSFVEDNDLKGTQFIMLWRGLGPIASGRFVTTREAQSLNIE